MHMTEDNVDTPSPFFSSCFQKSQKTELPVLRINFPLSFPPAGSQRQDPVHGRVQDAPGHGPAAGLRQEVPGEDGLQEAHQDEHAHGPGGEGEGGRELADLDGGGK